MLHSSTNSLIFLGGSKAIWYHGEQYLTTRYHQTSPLPHSASFLPKHNQLIRSTREMRLVCKALKATFGKSQRPIISGKPAGTPYCMGDRGMARFPRGSTWLTRLILERVTNRFRQSQSTKLCLCYLSLLGINKLHLEVLSMLRCPELSTPVPLPGTSISTTDWLHTFPRLLKIRFSIYVSPYAYHACRTLATCKIESP